MAKYVVARGGPLMDETVEADHVEVHGTGALLFTSRRQVPHGRSTIMAVVVVQAFAPGRWVEVMRSDG